MALTKITHSMSSTPGILDNSDATAITIGSDESVTLTSTVTTTGLIVNTDADSSFSIADGGTNAIVIKAAAGDELYMGANNTYAIRILNDGTNDVVLDNASNLGIGVSPKAWKTDWRVLNIGPEASFYSQANATAGIGENIYYNNSNNWVAVTTGPSSIYQLDSGTHNFYTMASVSAGATATPLQRMLIDNAGDTTFYGNTTVHKTGADSVIDVKGNSSHDAVLNLRSDQGAITTEGFQVWYDNSVGDVHLATTYADNAAAIRFHTATGANKVATGANERLTIRGDGNIDIPNGNLSFASGHGIDFSATANATGTSNAMSNELLEDYEEGTWYPYLGTEAQLGGASSSNYNNKYVKIGRLVHCTGWFNAWNYASITSGSYMMLRNLPFPPEHHSTGLRFSYTSNIGGSTYGYGHTSLSAFYMLIGGTTGAPTHYSRGAAPTSGVAYAMINIVYYTAS